MGETVTDRGVVGVVGLGYVGLPLALAVTRAGYDVVGVDVDGERVERLAAGDSYVNDVSDEELAAALDSGFTPTTRYEALTDAAAVSICVPTPLRKTGRPNLTYVVDAVERLVEVPLDGATVILESTVYPRATEELVAAAFEEAGSEVGSDVYVAYSPERIDPGNEEFRLVDIPKVVGGVTPACGDRAAAYYDSVFEEVVRMRSTHEAELVKLLENTFRAVNIGLINELALIAHELDIDIWDAIEGAATKPFGFLPFYPGPGLGGHCIPIDPFYLSWTANQQDVPTHFIDLADRINRQMPAHVVQRVDRLLDDRGIPLSRAEILVLGVSYKPDVSDTRESPAYDIIGRLQERAAAVSYHDPYVETFAVEGERYESVPLTRERIAAADCVVVVTDHADLPYADIAEAADLVFDTRDAFHGEYDHVHRL